MSSGNEKRKSQFDCVEWPAALYTPLVVPLQLKPFQSATSYARGADRVKQAPWDTRDDFVHDIVMRLDDHLYSSGN